MKARITTLGVVVALLVTAGVVFGHTGSIHVTSDCEQGNVVTAELHADVAQSATWSVSINGSVVDSGTGPGPRDLGPYEAGYKAGTAQLTISFGEESHVAIVEFGDVEQCSQPTPSPTPRRTPGPTPHPTPRPTLPPTDTE